MVAAFGSGAMFSLVSGMGGPNMATNAVTSGVFFALVQGGLFQRFSSAVAELNGAIYAAGGYDGEGYLNSAERFDPREVVSWSSIPSMNIRRGCHSLVAMSDKIYQLGGYNGENMVSSVEEFDPRNNSWKLEDMQLQQSLENQSLLFQG
ncbi:kelch-like protein 17 isoform X1 [Papaver somniferum]|nr:kelch-like protein 17 isoform X1 [Papaver somniferum]XP_026389407.1 kelch-like protein 17 isoform X1 [Papaver somniferum]XP_026389415.1 kelch-like protein 17 isoform X1 [Papaver somniferum]